MWLVNCNLDSLFENEGLLKATASDVDCKCGNFSETVSDRVVVTNADLIASDIWPIQEAILMTLRHLQGHAVLQAFRFCLCNAMFVLYLLSSRVRLFVCHKPDLYQNG